jgi:deoxyribodipyrimidine photo-lyase
MTKTALVWLRNDLRLGDNPALSAAFRHDGPVVALYIHETDPGLRAPGGASRWWLHHSLRDLSLRLAQHGVPLLVRSGLAHECVRVARRETGAVMVLWNRRYAPAERAIDTAIKAALEADGIAVSSLPGNVLAEPWTVQTKTGNPYSVYTPFWNTLKAMDIAAPLRAPAARTAVRHQPVDGDYLQPKWAAKLKPHWQIGEAAAQARLADFLDDHVMDYPAGRDIPALAATSRLSPHLRFGEISARQVWHAAQSLAQREPRRAEAVGKFLSELAWRDFNYHQLYHRDAIATVPMQGKYVAMHWRHAPNDLEAWQRGQTGFPLIDAGMRELWATGFMQNRVRMLVASLLAKNLLIDWRVGEHWFWDCLVDADGANNPGNWQWVAGSGLDASPYFRIFNPVTQGERFDADGRYVRHWVPEIARLPDQWIQQPVAAPADALRAAEIELGRTYPKPIVDLKHSRQRALDAARAL